MYVKVFLTFLFLLPVASTGSAQPADIASSQIPLAELNGPWRFHIGDLASWGDPAFDDSNWSLLTAKSSYDEQGYPGYAGLSWYRLRINAPSWPGPLALCFPVVADSYQVFVNGRQIGQVGGMPPQPSVVLTNHVIFPIPDGLVVPGKPLQIAVRVWRWHHLTMYGGGGLIAPPMFGTVAAVNEWQESHRHARYWEETDATVSFLANLLTALAGLALFVLRRKEREYLWFGMAQVLWAAVVAFHMVFVTRPTSYTADALGIAITTGAAMLLNLEFFITLMAQQKRLLYWTAAFSAALYMLALVPFFANWMSDAQFSALQTILQLTYGACVTAMIYEGAIKRSTEARLLLAPFTFSFFCNILDPLLGLPALAGIPWIQTLHERYQTLTTWPFPVRTPILAGDIAMFSVVAVLVFRYARTRTDEERLSAELEAARAVQHVLVPDEIPTVPGFQIECVYKPAGDVGGDFFQILPLAHGELLAVIGDVSGKGMPAAMTVSLIVGMVRMLVRTTHKPAEILSAINQNMMGRTSGGFTTCLILHISHNGTVTAANAGHVPPYLNGHELRVDNGLPLGLDANAVYDETTFALAPTEKVTLLTDGVLEARTSTGELFGFERAASLSAQPAAEIAAAAQRFGQEDDITVLSLVREPEKTIAATSAWSAASAD